MTVARAFEPVTIDCHRRARDDRNPQFDATLASCEFEGGNGLADRLGEVRRV